MKLLTSIIALTLAACSTLPQNSIKPKNFSDTVLNPPTSMKIEWSHTLPNVAGNHWVVFKVKLDPSTGVVTDMDAAPANDALDCIDKAHQISPNRLITKNALAYAEVRVCRQLAADNSPLDEDKIDEEGKVLPQDRGAPDVKKDNNI